MRTVLICHEEAVLTRDGLARWLASFSDLAGIVAIREEGRVAKRIAAELRRSGWLGLLDVLLYRLFHYLFLARGDRAHEHALLASLRTRYRELRPDLPVLTVTNPNSEETRRFVTDLAPDLAVVRCKFLLRPELFDIPPHGMFVMHPGICPEYRNAHGCFWALVNDDLGRVGMTLLKIDRGVDTGPVYGYFTYPFDEVRESHTVVQQRVVYENLPDIAATLEAVVRGDARPIDTTGRQSHVWGQPRLSSYVRWKTRARRRAAVAWGPR